MSVKSILTSVTAVVALVIGVLTAVPATASTPETVEAASVSTSLSETALGGPVRTADLSKFQPGNIISDAVFFNSGTMSEAQIQTFLESKMPSCRSGYTCLKDWYDLTRTTTADAMCGAYQGGTTERASRIIYKVAQACGINPQVILVMLQKEQGLVLSSAPSAYNYRAAMGQGCPDTADCDVRYYGFFNQVQGAAWQFKRYANPVGTTKVFTWYAPGKTWNVRYHPNADCGSSPVYIQNQATANLYYYTPYQPNAAALSAGYSASSDPCSSYGNRNFFQFFTDWFGSTQRAACDQPPYEQVRGASGLMKTLAVVPARMSSFLACNDGALWLDAGYRVSLAAEWGEWYWVSISGNMRWIQKASLTPVDACEQPPYAQVRGASGTMKTLAVAPARMSAYLDCNADALWLDAGRQVTVAAEWGEWYWVNVSGAMRWIQKASVTADSSCIQPPYEQVRGASGTMVVTSATTGRTTANVDCSIGSVALSAGTSVTLAAQWGEWYWANVNGAMVWIPVASVALAADPCAQPPYEQVRGSTGSFTTTGAVTAVVGPNANCANGAIAVPQGTTVTPGAQWGDWVWASVNGQMRWMPKASLAPAETCNQPPYAEVRGASGSVTLTGSAVGRVGPYATCTTGAVGLSAGTTVSLSALWGDWNWVNANGTMMWVLRSELSGTATTKTTTAAVNLRSAPSLTASILTTVPSGTIVTVIGQSTGWVNVTVGGRTGWMSADYVR